MIWKSNSQQHKVENILERCLDLIPSPLPSVKIQIMGGKIRKPGVGIPAPEGQKDVLSCTVLYSQIMKCCYRFQQACWVLCRGNLSTDFRLTPGSNKAGLIVSLICFWKLNLDPHITLIWSLTISEGKFRVAYVKMDHFACYVARCSFSPVRHVWSWSSSLLMLALFITKGNFLLLPSFGQSLI